MFSGCGGLDLAIQDLGEPIAYVEIEEYAQKIIAYRMADGSLKRAPILADVKNVRGSLGVCDLIIGGFPCQDISVAGNRAGLEGKRSGLFYEIIRLTKEIRPKFVFVENVEGIRTKGLREVTRAFADLGYDVRWTRVSAKEVGANHRRNRFFGLAYSDNNRHRLENEQRWISGKSWQRPTDTWSDGEEQSVAHTLRKGLERNKLWKPILEGFAWQSGEQRASWKAEPNVGRVANGVAFRVDRIKALGNGVVPAQARKAFFKLLGVTNDNI